MNNDTIVAISTPPGRGGIGIVRLSGPDAQRIAAPMLRLRHPLAAGHARFGELLSADGEKLDEIVATLFAAPNSYTGEDVLEIAAHGAPVILEAIVQQCIAAGARLANPGEFTERAFLSGRIDLTQAEAVRDLIDAQTLHQARIAAQQMEGALARRIQPVKIALVELIAALEAGIDFAEDDIDVMPAEIIAQKLAALREPLTQLAASFAYGRIVRDGLTLAIVGRPNAGKSSLFNRLIERERAIVTAAPGTTRDLITERVAIGGIPVELIDTAGLREGVDEAESLGIAKSREAMADADIVLLVLDASQPPHAGDEVLLESIASRPHIVVANKCDLALAYAANSIHTSALTGEGISALRDAIVSLVGGGAQSETGMLTNIRQREAIENALAGLSAAESALAAGTPHEMLLLDIYAALRGLDALTGATTADDVLNLIFSSFCIGK
ncbi:MAG TPA: tRNA uridine-5-carboxymethylaminomethyl(34) synthesis GTPase MnmE [Acidobacteriaceae bacterium]|nr:tRNA uridine-5-carboxymethylaminomethyl(34) synthesis GTPase MnmE [Acidobacteriaceae bacterium]